MIKPNNYNRNVWDCIKQKYTHLLCKKLGNVKNTLPQRKRANIQEAKWALPFYR